MTFRDFIEELLVEWKRNPPPPAGPSQFPFSEKMAEEVEKRIIAGETIKSLEDDLDAVYIKERDVSPDAGYLEFLEGWILDLWRFEGRAIGDWPWKGFYLKGFY